ncbi:transporter substrate-binding domain-containing protein [Marinobacter sp. CHS3-4]|uniref:transporter substrate-binding domain-containing protein n=1 Tax=Marinobacter sp. CHS3-4 TaxID=3045174 RepID=UPI0024B4FD93|nr:transporter substrate-binding domain-containing protein [Marinobacter sp. CHS3-4]MDI9244613.1 transporter substrate-binding domain-containing protein [Marinobacter sp. CHS3-4]
MIVQALKKRILPPILCATVLVGSASALADSYVVGVENVDYYPLYTSSGSSYSGFGHDVLDAFADASGHQLSYKPLPVARLTAEFLEGNTDLKFPDNPNWAAGAKQGKGVVYSDPVQSYVDGTMVLPENKGRGVEAINSLGIVRGFTPWDYKGLIDQGKVKLQEVSNLASLIKMARGGRVDGIYFNVDVARHALEEDLGAPGALVFDPQLPKTRSTYHLSTIQNPEVIEEFNEFLETNADALEAIRQKYGLD